MSELLERLDSHARSEAERTLALEHREREAAARLQAARETEAKAEARARAALARAKGEAASLVADIRRALAAEWERLKAGAPTRRGLEESRRRVAEAAVRLAPETSTGPEGDGPALTPGMPVVAEHLGLRGELVSLAGATATVHAGNITVRVPVHALRAAEAPLAARAGRPGATRVPEKTGVASELHLIGRTTDEARDLVERYLDDAFVAGLPTVRLVHGKGTGALRKTVRGLLQVHPLVESFREGEPAEGGAGATVAALKVS
jgi:DNA mismatch repair protein MutS2